MNREILFRGKRVDNGEWVYGSYNKIVGSTEMMTRFDVTDNRNHEFKNVTLDIRLITETVLPDAQGWDYSGCFRHHKIDPATVGQFTGLLDKNGNKIWEGDLLRCEIGNNDLLGRLSVKNPIDHVIGTICYIDKIGRFTIEVRSNPLDIVGIEIGWGREQFEIIGNIHDNPEQIKQQ